MNISIPFQNAVLYKHVMKALNKIIYLLKVDFATPNAKSNSQASEVEIHSPIPISISTHVNGHPVAVVYREKAGIVGKFLEPMAY